MIDPKEAPILWCIVAGAAVACLVWCAEKLRAIARDKARRRAWNRRELE